MKTFLKHIITVFFILALIAQGQAKNIGFQDGLELGNDIEQLDCEEEFLFEIKKEAEEPQNITSPQGLITNGRENASLFIHLPKSFVYIIQKRFELHCSWLI